MARNVSPEAAAAFPLVVHKALPERRRSNLVVFRCGSQSMHRRLFPLPPERTWDCLLSFYEPFEPRDIEEADGLLTGAVSKWDAFAQARFAAPALGLEGYEYFFLLDDDLEFRQPADIDKMFEVARTNELAMCQPSLTNDSEGFWLVTRHHPSSFLRFTNFVECMAPLLSARAVDILREELCHAVSGCGFDLVCHKILGPAHRMAVIDDVLIRHARPTDPVNGPFYRFLRSIGVDHNEEIAWFLRRHGLQGVDIATQGGIGLAQAFYPLDDGRPGP